MAVGDTSGTVAPGPTLDIFMSHDHDDTERADRLCRALAAVGVTVWLDKKEITPGERWAAELESGLEAVRAFAVIATRRAMQSRWVQTEYLAAIDLAHSSDREFPLVALVFEDVKLPLILRSFQYVDFRDDSQFNARVEELRRAIETLRPKPAGERLVSPHESDSGGEQANLGPELHYVEEALDRERRTIHQLQMVRAAAALVGVLIAIALLSMDLTSSIRSAVALAVAAVVTIACIGWGATFAWIAAARDNVAKLKLLNEGLTDCRERQQPACREWRVEFWRVLHGRTAPSEVLTG